MLKYLVLLLLLPSIALAQTPGSGQVGRIGIPGTWTPGVTASSTAGTPAYTTQVGSYVRIGSFIHVQFNIVLSGWTGSPSGNVTITGLPLTSTATTNDNGGCIITNYTVSGLASLSYGLTGVISTSSTVASIYEDNNTGVTQLTAAQAGTTPTLVGYCNYHI